MPGDTRLFLLSGRDGGMPRASSDPGDKLSCVSHSNLVNKNITVSFLIHIKLTQATVTDDYDRNKLRECLTIPCSGNQAINY